MLPFIIPGQDFAEQDKFLFVCISFLRWTGTGEFVRCCFLAGLHQGRGVQVEKFETLARGKDCFCVCGEWLDSANFVFKSASGDGTDILIGIL